MAHTLTIGQVAKATGVAAKTIRYYEEILALVRGQRSEVKDQIAELKMLQRELEQVLQRPLASARERRAKGCRCLEVESTSDGPRRA